VFLGFVCVCVPAVEARLRYASGIDDRRPIEYITLHVFPLGSTQPQPLNLAVDEFLMCKCGNSSVTADLYPSALGNMELSGYHVLH